jgi:heterodisulfide reductase subunit B
MKYAYYPGCSLRESAREYDDTTRIVLEALGAELVEIPGWTCCGAAAVEAVDRTMAVALPARNLALAGTHIPEADVLAPCSACYLNLLKAARRIDDDHELHRHIAGLLQAEGLELAGPYRVRHLLDVLNNDFADSVTEHVTTPLEGVRIAPYYGCQILRPYAVFDDPERPRSMEPVITAMGAEIHDWAMGAHCCGASLMVTDKEAALSSVFSILEAAEGADVIATVCPLCQMNLEMYQDEASRLGGRRVHASVLYLPQLMGLAFGFSGQRMQLGKNVALSGTMANMAAGSNRAAAPA